MQENFFEVKKTARYFSNDNTSSRKLLIVLHGYGQLPSYFLRKFDSLKEEWHVVAPEGLHRFYLSGTSGRVGASWMTKEAREKDIQDTNQLIKQFIDLLYQKRTYDKIVLLGFSQGAASASRFYYNHPSMIDHLIIWASVFPPDIEKEQLFQSEEVTKRHHFFVIGEADEYFNSTQQGEIIAFFKNLNFNTLLFKGNHDIHQKTLENILQNI